MRPWSHVKLPTPVTIQAITVPRLRCIGWLVLFLERGRSHPVSQSARPGCRRRPERTGEPDLGEVGRSAGGVATSVAAIEPAPIPVLGQFPQSGDVAVVDATSPAGVWGDVCVPQPASSSAPRTAIATVRKLIHSFTQHWARGVAAVGPFVCENSGARYWDLTSCVASPARSRG